MNKRAAWAVLAGVTLLVGLVLAIVPTSVSTGSGSDISCGSAVDPDSAQALRADFEIGLRDVRNDDRRDSYTQFQGACEQNIFVQRLIAFPVAGVGMLGLSYLGMTTAQRRSGSPADEPSALDALEV
jgi:hypothetical protein